MSTVDQETGEVLESFEETFPHIGIRPPAASEVPEFVIDEWGDEATAAINAVTEGLHYRKKRRTLLRLAEAAYLNVSQASVFRMRDCGSKVAHYKWRANDPNYEDAYLYLVGDVARPGLARLTRDQELDEDEALAISALVEARTRLRLASADAVRVLMDAMDASDRHGPMWRERIVAANSILDKADTEAAANTAPAAALVDSAIMTVYADPVDDDDDMQAGQQGNRPALPPPSAELAAAGESHSHVHAHEDDMSEASDSDGRSADAPLVADEPTR